jgi:hypothetical protein
MFLAAHLALTAYLLGLVGSITLWTRGYPKEGVYYTWVVHVQLAEFIIQVTRHWSIAIPNACAVMGILVNHLQVVVLWMVCLWYRITLPVHATVVLSLFTVSAMFYCILAIRVEITRCPQAPFQHLHWTYCNQPYVEEHYVLFLLSLILLSWYGLGSNAVVVVGNFLGCNMLYGTSCVTGTLMCFTSTMIPWVLLVLY